MQTPEHHRVICLPHNCAAGGAIECRLEAMLARLQLGGFPLYSSHAHLASVFREAHGLNRLEMRKEIEIAAQNSPRWEWLPFPFSALQWSGRRESLARGARGMWGPNLWIAYSKLFRG